MTFKLNMIFQSILTALQVANQYTAAFPKAQIWITAALTITQALLALLAHFVNPDGTPAATPYVK